MSSRQHSVTSELVFRKQRRAEFAGGEGVEALAGFGGVRRRSRLSQQGNRPAGMVPLRELSPHSVDGHLKVAATTLTVELNLEQLAHAFDLVAADGNLRLLFVAHLE